MNIPFARPVAALAPPTNPETALALRTRERDDADATATLARYDRRDAAATAALNLTTVQTDARAVTGRPGDVLEGAGVWAGPPGSSPAAVVKIVVRDVTTGRTARGALVAP